MSHFDSVELHDEMCSMNMIFECDVFVKWVCSVCDDSINFCHDSPEHLLQSVPCLPQEA